MTKSSINITLQELKNFYVEVFSKVGVAKHMATIVANNLLFADAKGADTHGVLRVPVYVKRLQKGLVNKNPKLTWEYETNNSVVLNADNGLGHYTTQVAAKKAIEKAQENGISFVSIYNNNHFGVAGCYAKLIADEGMIGFVTTNGAPLMAPVGGVERILGNNPFSFAIPRKVHDPIIFDMANSIVSAGRLMVAEHNNERIPEGWALDAEGNPTTDPYKGYKGGGTLVPIASHKGFGLSLIMDILSGVLSGANFGKSIHGLADLEHITGNGSAIIAINIEKIMPKERFFDRLEEFLKMVVDSKKSGDANRIYLPGEKGQENRKRNLKIGININTKLHQELQTMAYSLGATLYKYN